MRIYGDWELSFNTFHVITEVITKMGELKQQLWSSSELFVRILQQFWHAPLACHGARGEGAAAWGGGVRGAPLTRVSQWQASDVGHHGVTSLSAYMRRA